MLTRTGWLFVVISGASLVAGVVLGYVELVVLGCSLLAGLGVSLVWLLFRPRYEVTRTIVPGRVQEGEGAAGVLRVTNVGARRSAPVLAVEAFAGSTVSVAIPGLARGAEHMSSYLLPADRRGCYAVGPLRISSADPLRLIATGQTHGVESTLWVLPKVHRVSPVPTGRTQDLEGPTSAGAPRGGIAFHSLREYVPGDDVRQIHWRSTARAEKLMVRHTVVTNEPKILVVLDTSSDPYDGDSFEDAVRVAASLVAACVDHRYPTEMRTTGGVIGVVDPTGHGLSDVMDKLAAVQVSAADPGLSALLAMAARREQGVSMCAVTGQPTIEQGRTIGAVRGRFDMTTFVQVGERFGRPPMAISGVLGVSAETSEQFVRAWKSRIG